MTREHPRFIIDLRKVEGDGNFPCPKCGTILDPSDDSDTKYNIVETKINRNALLTGLVIKCKKCNSLIGIEGFVFTPPPRTGLRTEYDRKKQLYESLLSEVGFYLQKCLKRDGIVVHSIRSRVKEFDSFYEKIRRREIESGFFDRIEDLAAVRVICLYLSDLERIKAIIFNEFRVLRADTLRTRSAEHFGYMSDHYIVALPKEYSGPRYDEVKNLKCEIQVRTILMHAWATVSHHLDYKTKTDIPTEFKKDFNAISGTLYMADTHFEMLREKTERSKSKLKRSAELGRLDLDQEINLDSLGVYLLWKFPRWEVGNIQYLLRDIRLSDLKTLKELDSVANEYKAFFEFAVKRRRREKIGASELLRLCLFQKWPKLMERSLGIE
jgi:ppGpp synthetase/RelA/SpoT-type nucleotidyltranferase